MLMDIMGLRILLVFSLLEDHPITPVGNTRLSRVHPDTPLQFSLLSSAITLTWSNPSLFFVSIMLYNYFYHSCRSLILLALGTGSIYMGKITEWGAFSSCTSLAVHRRFHISALQCITNSALAYRKRGRMDLLLDCSHGLSIRSKWTASTYYPGAIHMATVLLSDIHWTCKVGRRVWR
ncbi:uncharacterized protein BDW70DRAFT_108310 [Aspergillus foveolatus]|uniref:uncharacterized protein n=1 Tax=Aspergillus foveolatus TaxID=210207 RepID=UPI003CCDCE11